MRRLRPVPILLLAFAAAFGTPVLAQDAALGASVGSLINYAKTRNPEYAAMQAEAEAKGLLRGRARQCSSLAPETERVRNDPKPAGRSSSANLNAIGERLSRRGMQMSEADHLRVKRDVCFNCQVPFDKHDDVGCREWRGTV